MAVLKRIISVLLVAFLCLGICACSKKDNKQEKPQTPSSQDSAQNKQEQTEEKKSIFTDDFVSKKAEKIIQSGEITKNVGILSAATAGVSASRGTAFAQEITDNYVADFQKSLDLYRAKKVKEFDKMVHVSTFTFIGNTIYMTYYANTTTTDEDPTKQIARLAYCDINDTSNMTFIDLQKPGDECSGGIVDKIYDTILMQKDDKTLYLMWTASVSNKYYRLYRTFDVATKKLGPIMVNRFKVGNITNDFSTTGIKNALKENEIGFKSMYSDIGIMQKLSTRVENGETYYYTGAYSGDFNCIIKSKDLITWEYVAQPDFVNLSKWENATYVIGDKCYYFVRQNGTEYGFLTVYDLVEKTWATPLLIEDCQSRSDFIVYNNKLYLFHAPTDRNHIGIVEVNTSNIANSKIILQAKMHTSCFYPFIQYGNGELYISYTVSRFNIKLAKFTLSKYLQ